MSGTEGIGSWKRRAESAACAAGPREERLKERRRKMIALRKQPAHISTPGETEVGSAGKQPTKGYTGQAHQTMGERGRSIGLHARVGPHQTKDLPFLEKRILTLRTCPQIREMPWISLKLPVENLVYGQAVKARPSALFCENRRLSITR